MWLLLLRDYAVLNTQLKINEQSYNPTFFVFSIIDEEILEQFNQSWEFVLQATTLLIGTSYWNNELLTQENTEEQLSKKSYLYEDFYLLLGIIVYNLSIQQNINKVFIINNI